MYYHFADLILRSEMPLTELASASPGPAECVVRAGAGAPVESPVSRWDHHWPAPAGGVSLSCARDGDAYRIGMTGLATFLIEDEGRAVTCRPQEALPGDTLEHLLIDQVLPRVLAHRGRLVIHAGCVVTPSGAIAFLGDSGAGKSTLCAELARAGHPLLGDDGVVVREAGPDRFDVLATYPGLRLLPGPLARVLDGPPVGSAVAHYSDKRRLSTKHPAIAVSAGSHPLRALYLLDEGPEISIQRLPAREAFMALLRATFQLHLEDRERSRALFARIGALENAVPVHRLTYPRSFSRLEDVRDAVLAIPSSARPSAVAV